MIVVFGLNVAPDMSILIIYERGCRLQAIRYNPLKSNRKMVQAHFTYASAF